MQPGELVGQPALVFYPRRNSLHRAGRRAGPVLAKWRGDPSPSSSCGVRTARCSGPARGKGGESARDRRGHDLDHRGHHRCPPLRRIAHPAPARAVDDPRHRYRRHRLLAQPDADPLQPQGRGAVRVRAGRAGGPQHRDAISGAKTRSSVSRASLPGHRAGRDLRGRDAAARRDGARILCHVSGRAIDPADIAQGSIWIMQDVTAQHAAQEAIVRAREQLESRVGERTRDLGGKNVELESEIEERRLAEEQLRVRGERLLYHRNQLLALARRDRSDLGETLREMLAVACIDAAPRSRELLADAARRARGALRARAPCRRGDRPGAGGRHARGGRPSGVLRRDRRERDRRRGGCGEPPRDAVAGAGISKSAGDRRDARRAGLARRPGGGHGVRRSDAGHARVASRRRSTSPPGSRR